MPALDPDKVAHDGPCNRCGARTAVLLAHCRLERRPWRLVWRCASCNSLARVRVNAEALPLLLGMDRAGGMPLSLREVAVMAAVDLDALNEALADEVL